MRRSWTPTGSTLIRVRDGTTIVLGGLIQSEKASNQRKVPLLGDIPWFGKLFTGTFRSAVKKELVMFVTPHIVRDDEISAQTPPEKVDDHPKVF
jgi:type II secretory pathway component GspD/PulD (secretin)